MLRAGLFLALFLPACRNKPKPVDTALPTVEGHGSFAADITAPMGEPLPSATESQREIFALGQDVAQRRFDYADGLGPAFNVTFCGSCHEKPVLGGGGGLYRNFFLTGIVDEYQVFFPAESAGPAGGVVRMYQRPGYGDAVHPTLDSRTNVIAQRNPIAFFGSGLLAEIEDDVLLERADPDDADGDGISGRPNYDRGFVGRFGRKAQTVSIEGFIRGPLMNHLGVTTNPLSEAQKAALPVDSSSQTSIDESGQRSANDLMRSLLPAGQAAANDGPTTDDDGVPDPEMSTDDLFLLVSFTMLTAAPDVRTDLTDHELRGVAHFDRIGCDSCHTPRLQAPRGMLPVYSDLLLHDMGEELADGLIMGEADGAEFRTQPLWGLTAVGPYLHDGRATTVDEAIRMHGGEAARSQHRYEQLSTAEQTELLDFLASLGGAEQATGGLLLPNQPIPDPGDYGGPTRELTTSEYTAFSAGRDAFDLELGLSDGVGGPRYNGDSCRACHFDPVIGGAGPRGVNVIRHAIWNNDGEFVAPSVGTILHRLTALPGSLNRPQEEVDVYELRSTPPLFGLGLVEGISDEDIVARADPDDLDGDGISGRVSWVDGDRVGRFGWKSQIPTLAEFTRDALTAELGLTVPYKADATFGRIQDNDSVSDPESTQRDSANLLTFMQLLGPPPRQASATSDAAVRGEALFDTVGCADCHVPELDGADGPVPLFSDLLLHAVTEAGTPGIEEAGAGTHEFRTAPLWGLATSAPYLHDSSADTISEAIGGHGGESDAARTAFNDLTDIEQADLLTFLSSL